MHRVRKPFASSIDVREHRITLYYPIAQATDRVHGVARTLTPDVLAAIGD
jgi:hypothetical protein